MRKQLVLVALLAVGLAVVAGAGRAVRAAAAAVAEHDRRDLRRAGGRLGRPGLGVCAIQAARRRGAARQPLLGRPERRRAQEASGERAQPERSRLRLVGLRRDGQASRPTTRSSPSSRSSGRRRGQAPAKNMAPRRTIDLRNFAFAAAKRYSGSFHPTPEAPAPARRTALDGVERAEQPGLPQAPVHEDQPAQVQARQPADLREHVQRDHVGRPPDGARRREGRLRRDRAARKQQRGRSRGRRSRRSSSCAA